MPAPFWLTQYEDLWLFDELRTSNIRLNIGLTKVVIGQFFEVLAAKIFKAEHAKSPADWTVYPDVIKYGKNGDGDTLYEVKGGAKDFIIDVGQINEYEKMCFNKFPFNKPKVKYVLFVHNLNRIEKNITEKYQFVPNLVEAISQHVLMSIVFPYDLVKRFPDHIPLYEYGKWGTGSRGGFAHKHFLRLRRFRISQWLQGGVKALRGSMIDVFGSEVHKWKFETKRVNRMKVIGYKVNPFNMVEIITND